MHSPAVADNPTRTLLTNVVILALLSTALLTQSATDSEPAWAENGGEDTAELVQVHPVDGGHTTKASQPIIFKVEDEASVDVESVTGTLLSPSGNSTDLDISIGEGIAKSQQIELDELGEYNVDLQIRYQDGHELTKSTVFNRIDVEIEPPTVTLQPLATSDAQLIGRGDGAALVFNDVPVDVSDTVAVRTGPLASGGIGYLAHNIDLSNFDLTIDTGLISPVRLGLPDLGGDLVSQLKKVIEVPDDHHFIYQQMSSVEMAADVEQMNLSGLVAVLDSLELRVPADFVPVVSDILDDITISFAPEVESTVPVCARPAEGCEEHEYPTQDPFLYRLPKDVSDVLQGQDERGRVNAALSVLESSGTVTTTNDSALDEVINATLSYIELVQDLADSYLTGEFIGEMADAVQATAQAYIDMVVDELGGNDELVQELLEASDSYLDLVSDLLDQGLVDDAVELTEEYLDLIMRVLGPFLSEEFVMDMVDAVVAVGENFVDMVVDMVGEDEDYLDAVTALADEILVLVDELGDADAVCADIVIDGVDACTLALDGVSTLRQILLWDPLEGGWGPYLPSTASLGVQYLHGYPILGPDRVLEDCARLLCAIELEIDPPVSLLNEVAYPCPEYEGTIYESSNQCYQIASLNGYVNNGACESCGESRTDRWFINGQIFFSVGVNDAPHSEMAWGIQSNRTTTMPNYDQGTRATTRNYVRPYFNQDTQSCEMVASEFLSNAPNDSRIQSHDDWEGFWSGAQFLNLRQHTRWYTLGCSGTEDPVHNRLEFAQLAAGVCFRSNPCSHPGNQANYRPADANKTLGVSYGHNRSTTRWAFGCGPSFTVMPPGAPGLGCGWTPEADSQQVWMLGLRMRVGEGNKHIGGDIDG